MPLPDKLRQHGARDRRSRTEPLWQGPGGDGPNGGVSFSLLSRWLCCKERFRIQTVEGWCPNPKFEPKMDFGSMWHVCEEAYAGAENKERRGVWTTPLQHFCQGLVKRFPTQQQQISHWYELCKAQFPLYQEYWAKHDNLAALEPVSQEQVFDVEYDLPSGRKVRLKGKWDSVHLYQDQVWLWENKTKSGIDRLALERQLTFDLQTMLYLCALQEHQSNSFWQRSNKKWRDLAIGGVRYNVVRRSAHKSVKAMVEKVAEDYSTGRIGEWFSRWDTRISAKDIDVFKAQCLHPILETLCNWWEWITSERGKREPFGCAAREGEASYVHHHWRHPFGVYNILNEGGFSDLDGFIATGSTVGLCQSNNLFPELQEAVT